jgi:murein DD-endopeptidase MepM/ murein hydrolase activator NlpD
MDDTESGFVLRRIALSLVLCFIALLVISSSVAAQTQTYTYTLTGSTPYIETTVHIRAGDNIRIRQWGSAALYPPGRTVPWVATGGDPGCTASDAYTLPGVNCWALIARVGNGTPFLVGADWEGMVTNNGKLYVGINHEPPLTASGSYHIQVIHNPIPAPTPPPPFLAVPWEYDSERTFEDVILDINSYFDHEYPLLSVSAVLDEPEEMDDNVVTYLGNSRSVGYEYSSHDGYDWGRMSGAGLGTPLLAAAAGCATYAYCDDCGYTIRIDHGNHYQTRYYHLQETDLITTDTNACTEVEQGDQIGLVGVTGNTSGAHLHFMVIEDKDQDGDFNDNIPDGLTDPFGWQSEDYDPWPDYTFTHHNVEKTGNDSFYLWEEALSTLNQALPTNGGVFPHNKLKLAIAPGSVVEKATVFIQAQPFQFILDNLSPVGSIFEIVLKNLFGTPITTLSQPATVTVSFADEDLSNVDMNQALIYSSNDGIAWAPHETNINHETQEAVASTTHFSLFALAAPRIDSLAPETSVTFDHEAIGESAYPLPLKVALEANDASPSAGLGHTFYRLNDDEWQLFSEPIEVTQAGDYTIHYYSADAVDNIESFKSASFSAVLAPAVLPEIIMGLSNDFKTIEVESNEAEAEIVREQLSLSLEKITADAGLGVQTSLIVKKNKFLLTETWALKSLHYGAEPEVALSDNLYAVTRLKSYRKPHAYTAIIQSWYMDKRGVLLTYYPGKNITTVVELLNNRKLSSKTYAGFKQLKLSTLEGAVVYNY